ncbi:histidine phosphatase family protein [Knoellia subterranea]|uniref:Phosphoglycerate mutase n=1 Tax=Knoellia subterranea KCTC 19937 TaxID=1385521 RepID=A0A0A0JNC4_9MICO|nr:histidine phosphatase family protein [Knoellia subterranea]KGN38643.1 phosphoglycerate mutase [Knoellia subterranea KCTC 19937]
MTGAPPVPEGRLVLVRHGKTEWSESGQHTGTTDIPLTEQGEADAATLAERLSPFDFGLVLTSPMQRARRTAEIAGFPSPEVDPNLVEWDYGAYEGRTTKEIRADLGHDWTVFEDGVVPGASPGETVEEVAARASRVLLRATPVLAARDVLLFGHGHALRILATVFLREQPRFGAKLLLDAGSVSVLEYEREQPAIKLWNSLG